MPSLGARLAQAVSAAIKPARRYGEPYSDGSRTVVRILHLLFAELPDAVVSARRSLAGSAPAREFKATRAGLGRQLSREPLQLPWSLLRRAARIGGSRFFAASQSGDRAGQLFLQQLAAALAASRLCAELRFSSGIAALDFSSDLAAAGLLGLSPARVGVLRWSSKRRSQTAQR